MTFVVVTAVTAIQAKHDNEIISLQKMIEKPLLLKKSSSTTPLTDFDTIPKAHTGGNSLSKITSKKWN